MSVRLLLVTLLLFVLSVYAHEDDILAQSAVDTVLDAVEDHRMDVTSQVSADDVVVETLLTTDVRGGDLLITPAASYLQTFLQKSVISPYLKLVSVLLVKSLIVSFIAGELLAYLGFIGDRGEGLYEWAVEHEDQLHHWLRPSNFHPFAALRERLNQMSAKFHLLPPKPKFVSAVGTGVTFFPLILKTSLYVAAGSASTLVAAEFLALVVS